jgi:hypothetical protein
MCLIDEAPDNIKSKIFDFVENRLAYCNKIYLGGGYYSRLSIISKVFPSLLSKTRELELGYFSINHEEMSDLIKQLENIQKLIFTDVHVEGKLQEIEVFDVDSYKLKELEFKEMDIAYYEKITVEVRLSSLSLETNPGDQEQSFPKTEICHSQVYIFPLWG